MSEPVVTFKYNKIENSKREGRGETETERFHQIPLCNRYSNINVSPQIESLPSSRIDVNQKREQRHGYEAYGSWEKKFLKKQNKLTKKPTMETKT